MDNDYYLEIQRLPSDFSVRVRMPDNGIFYPPNAFNYTTSPRGDSYEDYYRAVQAERDYYSTSSDVMMVCKHLFPF